MFDIHNCEDLRRQIKDVADKVKEMRGSNSPTLYRPGVDRGEAIANATLAYRHLEDASMRLGKTIQALDGGISVYDKSQVPGA